MDIRLHNIKILHSLRDDMVDCDPEEILSTEEEHLPCHSVNNVILFYFTE